MIVDVVQIHYLISVHIRAIYNTRQGW